MATAIVIPIVTPIQAIVPQIVSQYKTVVKGASRRRLSCDMGVRCSYENDHLFLYALAP